MASRHSNPDHHSTVSLLALEAEMAETSTQSRDVAMEAVKKQELRVAASKMAARVRELLGPAIADRL